MPSDQQRERLYQNALELFYHKGFKATTMRDLASSMNFEAASLYNYIKSKDALLEELLFDVADQFLNGIIQIRSSKIDHIDQLSSVIGLYVSITAANPYKAALLTTEWRNLKDPVLTRFIDHRSTFENHLRDLLKVYYAQNKKIKMDTDIVLHTFLGSTRWIYDWYIKQEDKIDDADLERKLSDIILNGITNSAK